MLHKSAYGGAHLPLPGLEPVGGEPLMSVTRGQCDARPAVTFPTHWLVPPNYTELFKYAGCLYAAAEIKKQRRTRHVRCRAKQSYTDHITVAMTKQHSVAVQQCAMSSRLPRLEHVHSHTQTHGNMTAM